jgi:hypothetical protein
MTRDEARARLRAIAEGRDAAPGQRSGAALKAVEAAFVVGFLLGVSPRVRRLAASTLARLCQRASR